MADHAPSVAMEAVLKPSCDLPEDMPKIKGYDFNQGVDLHAVLKSYLTTGFQASSLGLAIQEINHMVSGMNVGLFNPISPADSFGFIYVKTWANKNYLRGYIPTGIKVVIFSNCVNSTPTDREASGASGG